MPRNILNSLRIGLILLLSVLTGSCFAQDYFAFISAANKRSFYARVDSQFYSSTPEGHLILSRLKDSTYKLTIGFPGQTASEQHYVLSIRGRDREFQLRQNDNGGLKLYDVQAKGWLPEEGGTGVQDEFRTMGIKKDDAFSRMMAGVVKDTAVLYNAYAMEQALNDTPALTNSTVPGDSTVRLRTLPDPTQAPISSDTASFVVTGPSRADSAKGHIVRRADSTLVGPVAGDSGALVYRPAAGTAAHRSAPLIDSSSTADAHGASGEVRKSTDTMITATPVFRPIVKVSERRTSRNLRQVYVLRNESKRTDTVDVVIPVDSGTARQANGSVTHVGRVADSSRLPVSRNRESKADSPTTSNRLLVPAKPLAADPLSRHADTVVKRPGKEIPFINSDCHDLATDYDTDKFRSKLLEAFKDEDRLTLARKTFKMKCFSTKQLRLLVPVFATDAGRFRFLEVAWPFAADEHFHELSDLLTDPVYISKFKTMTHQP